MKKLTFLQFFISGIQKKISSALEEKLMQKLKEKAWRKIEEVDSSPSAPPKLSAWKSPQRSPKTRLARSQREK